MLNEALAQSSRVAQLEMLLEEKKYHLSILESLKFELYYRHH